MQKRVLGAEHPSTLSNASNLAMSLLNQGKHADAERIQREMHGVQKRVLGAEHPDTLMSANNLAGSLSGQGKHAEAEQMLHGVLGSLQRVLGPAHPSTLRTARSLERVRLDVRARIRGTPPTNAAATATAARPLPNGTRVLLQRLVAKPEHMNGTFESKKRIFIGIVALIVQWLLASWCFLLRILAVVEQPINISTSN